MFFRRTFLCLFHTILKGLSECFTDDRAPALIEHTVESLINQRVMGIAFGYEDLNDHDQLRQDPVLAVCCDHQDPLGLTRHQEEDKGKSSLNRLELTPEETAGEESL